MKAKIAPTSPKRNVTDEQDVDQFLSTTDSLVQPMKPRRITTILFFGMLGGIIAGSIGAILLTNLALSNPSAPFWGWLGITFPENGTERVIIRDQGTTTTIKDVLSKVGPAVVTFTSQAANILDRDLTGSGLVLSSDGFVASVDGVSQSGSVHAILSSSRTVATTGTVAEDSASPLTTFRLDTTGLSLTTFAAAENLGTGDQLMIVRRTAQGDLAYQQSPLVQMNALPHANGADFYRSTETFSRRHYVQPLADVFLGAPVFTMNGEAVGLVLNPATGEVIPLDILRPILNRLLNTGAFERTKFGVRYQDLRSMPSAASDAPSTQTLGARIAGDADQNIVAIAPGSPAENAELAAGDIITAVNDIALSAPEDFTTLVQRFSVGEKIQVTFMRDNSEQHAEVTLGSQ